MKKILITGSNGFIGKNLKMSLDQFSNHKVFCLELDDYFVKGEDWSTELLRKLDTYNPEVVFHVGACSDTLEQDVNLMMQMNFESTKVIVDWVKDNRAKVIYSSSAANYGDSGFFPSNLYGWSKYVAESYVVSNGGIGLRYFNVYGPGEEHKGRMSSVALQSYKKIREGAEVYLFPGNPKRDFVYIKDIVSANINALVNYWDLNGDWYDIGSYEARTFEDVLSGMGISDWKYKNESEIPTGYQFFTLAKKRMPGWDPKFRLEEGLKDYVKYLTQNE